jgi:hypothetical protein
MALERITNRLANGAVQAVGADHPTRFQHSLVAVERTQSRPDAPLALLETDELDAALDLAAKLLELVREDALRLFLGEAKVEGKRTVETVEPDGGDLRRAREEIEAANDVAAPHEPVRQAHAGENFERAGFHDDRAVAAERLGAAVDKVNGRAATRELDREDEPGRTGSDNENGAF